MNRREQLDEKQRQDRYIIIGVGIVLALLIVVMVFLTVFSHSTPAPDAISFATSTGGATTTDQTVPTSILPGSIQAVNLAQCLANKKITMYGAAWCTHCQDQKAAFGSAWKDVPYVECPDNVQVCISKGVLGYPTWIKPDGTKEEGFIPLDKLATWANCQI